MLRKSWQRVRTTFAISGSSVSLIVFALSRRRNASEIVIKPKISSSKGACTVFHSLMGELPYEEFWMLLLNRANKIMKTVKVSEGRISGGLLEI
ncbi:MAG: JAB domain-containing protein, partial [Bacteroidota bacterium]